MKLGARKPGTSTSFVDSATDEVLLQFSWDADGIRHLAYHLYDADGSLVADSGGVLPLEAVNIEGREQELLLNVPQDQNAPVRYRLYSRRGVLITSSDGARTQIYSYLKMEPGRAWPGATNVP